MNSIQSTLSSFTRLFINIFDSIYDNFYVSVACVNKLTKPIRVQKGVLQGDPCSPLLFNVCFNSLMKVLETPNYSKIGYIWGKRSSQQCNWLQYADDAAIIAKDQKGAQGLACLFESWCNWAKMIIRLDKCICFGMVKKQSKTYAQILPNISLASGQIPAISIGEHFQYLGRIFDYSLDDDCAKRGIVSKLENFLKIITNLHIKPQTKLKFFLPFYQLNFCLN
ncbi:MAG: reverse transcriptase domain-containing protein [Nitrososphaerales archaeon]